MLICISSVYNTSETYMGHESITSPKAELVLIPWGLLVALVNERPASRDEAVGGIPDPEVSVVNISPRLKPGNDHFFS